MKKVLYMHGGSGNHGCEALVRTTAGLLGGPQAVELWSSAKEEDIRYGSAGCVERIYVSEEIERLSPAHFEALFRRRMLKQSDANMKIFLRELFKDKAAISIGGDNYCYPWSASQAIELDREIRKHCKANVLWGCSIDEEAVTPQMREDLAGFDLITARESLTYEMLRAINPNTKLVADPAFLLDTEKLPLPSGFAEGNTVGINVSPLIMKYGTEDNLILENYKRLIAYVLEQTDMSVCLIPHVVWSQNDDRTPIRHLLQAFEQSDRVCMIEDANCMQLKGYIARCRFFVGARTHATIAAYSSCVPTLVVGYSVKSRGIAKDLFGTDAHYVLPVQKLAAPDDLLGEFRWMMEREREQKERLQSVIPEYIHRAERGRTAFDTLE